MSNFDFVINCYKQMTEKMDNDQAKGHIKYTYAKLTHGSTRLITEPYSLLDSRDLKYSRFPYLEYLKDKKVVDEIKAYEQLRFVKLCKSGFFDNLIQAKHFKKCVDKSIIRAHKYALTSERKQDKTKKQQEKIEKYINKNYQNLSSED